LATESSSTTIQTRNQDVADSLTHPNDGEGGSYTIVVEGYDWGPVASKVILDLKESASSVEQEHFTVSANKQAACNGEKADAITGERTILEAFSSDEKGNKVPRRNHITLTLSVGPTITVIPTYQRLIEAGSENVHLSLYDHVVAMTGLYGGEGFYYLGHFSWIYFRTNHRTLDYHRKPVRLEGQRGNFGGMACLLGKVGRHYQNELNLNIGRIN